MKPKSDEPLSNLAFKFNLRRYTEGALGEGAIEYEGAEGEEGAEEDGGWIPGAISVRVAYFEIAGKRVTDLLSPQRTEIALKEVGGRGLHSSTIQLTLSRFSHKGTP